MQKLVLLLLANRTNPDSGQCTPSHERLAKDCGMTSRSVKAQIAKLVEAGLVVITARSKEGLTLSNQYTLVMDEAGRNVIHPTRNDIPTGRNEVPEGSEPDSYLGGNDVPTKHKAETINETGNTYIAPRAAKKYSAMSHLQSLGVDEQVAFDWLEVRKAKKAAQIKTQIEDVIAELASAGYSANDGLKLCIKKNWAKFEQAWLANTNQPQPQYRQAPQQGYESAKDRARRELAEQITGGKRDDIRTIDIN